MDYKLFMVDLTKDEGYAIRATGNLSRKPTPEEIVALLKPYKADITTKDVLNVFGLTEAEARQYYDVTDINELLTVNMA